MSKIKSYIILFSFSIMGSVLWGQDLPTVLSNEINTLRGNKYGEVNDQILLKFNNTVLLDSLKKYEKDTLSFVRFNVQQLEIKIVRNNLRDTAIKREVINRLVNWIKDPDILIRQNALRNLLTFSASDFDEKSKESINKIINDSTLTKDLILLIGTADIQEQKKSLYSKIKSNPLNTYSDFYSLNWAMHLALARMGDVESLKYCINNVENFKDEILKITVLLYDIGYIRREAAVDYIKKYLSSSDRLPSLKVNDMGTPYSQYALDVLANIVEDFPVKPLGIGYTDDEIETAKEWMESHSQYKIKR